MNAKKLIEALQKKFKVSTNKSLTDVHGIATIQIF